jgi:small-conductance mechanosensitive channel
MKRKIAGLIVIVAVTVAFWAFSLKYPSEYADKGVRTLVALSILYSLFKIVFDELVGRRIPEDKERYTFKKMVSTAYSFFILVAAVTIWVPNPEALLVAYGIIAAGVAVSLQDVFKNLAGGITLFITGIYAVGDRIEIKSKHGDVIDVGILYTTLLELRGWVEGDQATGRLTIIPNGLVLSENVNNYTKDNRFIWDELTIPIAYDSDWKRAEEIVMYVLNKEPDPY